MRARFAIAFVLVWPCAAENAVFDRQGRVSAMIYGGDELSVRTICGSRNRMSTHDHAPRVAGHRADGGAACDGIRSRSRSDFGVRTTS